MPCVFVYSFDTHACLLFVGLGTSLPAVSPINCQQSVISADNLIVDCNSPQAKVFIVMTLH